MACQTSKCGSGPQDPKDLEIPLSPDILARVKTHPCYSEAAHYRFARMHLAVAPGCNIQCNYCNRKYDCANESRPGVTSERLTPEQAALKVEAVRKRIPRLSVVGIAGPGDPLANPERTFRTFRLIQENSPALQLCVSTNGLMLPEHMESIKACGIHHVTITINATDPDIGAEIYAWVSYRGRRYSGRDGAALLMDRQMQGLDLLRANGILCKVNSVLIPGINDAHMVEVNRVVSSGGAFLHNVMPLISSPEHGTYFGLNGRRGPTEIELRDVRNRLVGDARLMRHCRQCRADAVGLLGEDRSQEFTKEKLLEEASLAAGEHRSPLRVAVATTGDGIINEHFGQVERFHIYEVAESGVTFLGERSTDFYCLGGSGDGDALNRIVDMLKDCRAVFVARVGPCPGDGLRSAGIEPVEEFSGRPIDAALIEFYERNYERMRELEPGHTV